MKKTLKGIIGQMTSVVAAALLISCNGGDDTNCHAGSPYLFIQPDGTFTAKELRELAEDVKAHKNFFVHATGSDSVPFNEVAVLATRPFETGDVPGSRLRADIVLKRDTLARKSHWPSSVIAYDTRVKGANADDDLSRRAYGVVYVTKRDICTPHKGIAEWGVLGLSFLGTKKGIISTFRLRRPRDLWKLVAHETNHGQGVPHCSSGDIHCIMQDAQGHPKFHIEEHVCPACRDYLHNKK